MRNFFKKEEKAPFTYTAIEERRTSPNYFVWAIVIVLLITTVFLIFFLK